MFIKLLPENILYSVISRGKSYKLMDMIGLEKGKCGKCGKTIKRNSRDLKFLKVGSSIAFCYDCFDFPFEVLNFNLMVNKKECSKLVGVKVTNE